jgi:hypothetical protein
MENSRNFAHWINSLDLENQMELISLKKELETYFGLLKKMKLEEFYMKELSEKQKLKTTNDFLYLLLIFPFIPLGLIHFYLPYIFVKTIYRKNI